MGGRGEVSVVICSHRIERWNWLCQAVASVEEQRVEVAEIVVVIDGDPHLAKRALNELSSICNVVVRDTRGGLSAARNSGVELVQTQFVAFLDDDAEADKDWIALLIEPMSDLNTLGSGGRSVPIWDGEKRPVWFPEELLWVVGCSYRGLPETAGTVRNVFGGCAIYRTELFDKFGGFKREFGRQERGAAGCEETEFCIRVAAGSPNGSFRYEPDAIIRHHVPANRERLKYVIERSFAEGRSKALLVRHFGDKALSWKLGTEIRFLRSTVVRALGAGLVRGARGDTSSIAGVGALIVSLASAMFGYGVEMFFGKTL